MSFCPVDISSSGTILNPLQLYTLLTSLTNHAHVYPLHFRNEDNEFDLDFRPSLTVFTPQELENMKQPISFCHFHAANQLGFQAWLSACNPEKMEMILHTPSISFSLDHSNGSFHLFSRSNGSCEMLRKPVVKRETPRRISDPPYTPHTLPAYYHDYSHLFSRKRFVELAFFADYSMYEKYGKNEEKVMERMRSIIHMANSYFNSLRIEVQVVRLQVYNTPDAMNIDFSGKGTIFPSWGKFLEKMSGVHFDHATLITHNQGKEDETGVANMDCICCPEKASKQRTSRSWILDYDDEADRMAAVFAHELGHTLGIDHDRLSEFSMCECPVGSCIASAEDEDINAQHWSNCSLAYLDKLYQTGADYCLWNDPREKGFAYCGNGIVEEGEDCDCGADGCVTHDCCDAQTCKYRDHAKCASGTCCDLNTCTISPSDSRILCRNAKNTCDHAEFCDGVNSECPDDLFLQNGDQCPDDSNAICFNGRCGSRLLQCKEIWGNETKVAAESCYVMRKQSKNGDELCGKLHCDGGNDVDSLLFGWEVEVFVENNECKSVLAKYQKDYVPDYHIGMTPDGTSCALDKYCLNGKCVPKANIFGNDQSLN